MNNIVCATHAPIKLISSSKGSGRVLSRTRIIKRLMHVIVVTNMQMLNILILLLS